MNRKLGQLIKATLFALPFALPGVALAQSAGANTGPGSSVMTGETTRANTTDTTNLDNSTTKDNGAVNTQRDRDDSNAASAKSTGASDLNAGSSGSSTGSFGGGVIENSDHPGTSLGAESTKDNSALGTDTDHAAKGSSVGTQDNDRDSNTGTQNNDNLNNVDRTQGAGSLSDNPTNLNEDTVTTHTTTKHKKIKKSSKRSQDLNNDSDLNR